MSYFKRLILINHCKTNNTESYGLSITHSELRHVRDGPRSKSYWVFFGGFFVACIQYRPLLLWCLNEYLVDINSLLCA